MKKFKRLIASLITFISLLAINPIITHAEWKSDSTGWWYAEGNSWVTGWKLIDGNWYYFHDNGYMAHDITINGYYLNSSGAWTTGGNNNSYGNISANEQSENVYVSNNGIYHKNPNAHRMKNYTTMSLSEAQSKGYKACESCYK